MNKAIIIFIVVLALGGIGAFLFLRSNQNSSLPQNQNNSSSQSSRKIEGYQGNVLAGNASPFLEFNKVDYEKAKSEGKIIVLNFFANWCPICRVEQPELYAGFDSLTTDKVIGFRINYNDSDTDSDEQALANEFSIPYQHTKIILKNGKEVIRSGESWTKEQFLEEINKTMQ